MANMYSRFSARAAAFVALLCALAAGRAFAAEAVESKPLLDPLQVVISLDQQQLKLYRGETLLATSRVSTGKRRYRTPRGVYSIIEKRRRHFSNLYRRAPMPYMQRITWSGIALHQGHVPNHPASHGCIRMPHKFARSLFRQTKIGAGVVITKEPQAPSRIDHPKLFVHRVPIPEPEPKSKTGAGPLATSALPLAVQSAIQVAAHYASVYPGESAIDVGGEAGTYAYVDIGPSPEDDPALKNEPVRVLILASPKDSKVLSSQKMLLKLGYDVEVVDGLFGRRTSRAVTAFQRDKALKETGVLDHETVQSLYAETGEVQPSGHLYVRRGRREVFDTPIELKDQDMRVGTHLFTAMAFEPAEKEGDSAPASWTVVTVDAAEGATGADPVSALDRVTIPAKARKRIEAMLRPGSTLIVSDADYGWETGKGTDFIVQPR